MDYLNEPIFASIYGRSDFITGIDNEALDFAQLEAFIHGASTQTTNNVNTVITTDSHLPESPPDSGSEQPNSPREIHLNLGDGQNYTTTDSHNNTTHSTNTNKTNINSVNNNNSNIKNNKNTINNSNTQLTELQQDHTNNSLNTQHHNDSPGDIQNLNDLNPNSIEHINSVTELHVTGHRHHNHHNHQHHSMLTNPNTLYITNDHTNPHQTNGHEQQILIHQNPSGIMELEHQRNYQRTDLLDMSQQPSRIQDVFHHQHLQHTHQHNHPSNNHIQLINGTNNINTRKRKLSQQNDLIVKPEPGRELNEAQYVTNNHQDIIYCTDHTNTNLQDHTNSNGVMEPASPNSVRNLMGLPTNSIGSPGDNPSTPNIDTQSNGTSQQQLSDSGEHCPLQCIRFSPFQQQNWHLLCDQTLQELPIPHYRVDADKGFNFSNSDDAFVCQKKNHFQITCHAQLQGTAVFVRTTSGLEKIRSFHLHFYGVKLEVPTQTIRVEQSQSDRSKKPFHPVPIDLQTGQVSKVTVGRLHFSETTSNNMRKKGRPNPEQRYFQLVVGLYAHTHSGNFPIISHGSERIIVRASNPGQFESDVELTWQRGATQESIYHAGRVGINTDRPDESLVIHGNLKISGHIIHPSDSRAKQEISELDTSQQLMNVQKIRVVRYRYEPDFAEYSGLTNNLNNSTSRNCRNNVIDTGVIAQEVQKILPDAVQETGSLTLPNGQIIDNFLVVNKERIFLENIGAVKELCKVTGSLETRIEQLERINARIQKIDRKKECNIKKCKHYDNDYEDEDDEYDKLCSNKMVQIIIIILVIIMTVCLTAISTLYFVEHNKHFTHYDDLSYEAIFNRNSSYINPLYGSPNNPNNQNLQQTKHNSNIHYYNNPINHDAEIPPLIGPTKLSKSNLNTYEENYTKYNKTDFDHEKNVDKYVPPVLQEVDTNFTSKLLVNISITSTTIATTISTTKQSSSNPFDIESNAIDRNQYLEKKNETKHATFHSKVNKILDKSNNEANELQPINTGTNHENFDIIPIDPEELITNTRTYPVAPIGEPHECLDIKNIDTLSQCQCYTCCEDINKNLAELPAIIPPDGGGNIEFKYTHNITKISTQINSAKHQLSEFDEHPVEIKESNMNNNENERDNSSEHSQKDDNIEPLSQDILCYTVHLKIRGEQFNITYDQLTLCKLNDCLNITYLIPISKHMQDNQIELNFISHELKEWNYCSRKYKSVNYDEYFLNLSDGKFVQNYSKSSFIISFPAMGSFEKYLEFRTPLVPTQKNICQLNSNQEGQYIQYIIKFYRDCEN